MATEGLTTATASATLVTAIGVLIAVTVEIPFPRGSQRAIVSIFAAVGLFCVAVGLTGGLTSSFVVMPLASIFLAAIGGGVRAAAPVTIVAVAGVLIAAWAAGDDVTIDAIIRIPAIYTITGIAFSEVQRALTSESERADDLLLGNRDVSNETRASRGDARPPRGPPRRRHHARHERRRHGPGCLARHRPRASVCSDTHRRHRQRQPGTTRRNPRWGSVGPHRDRTS